MKNPLNKFPSVRRGSWPTVCLMIGGSIISIAAAYRKGRCDEIDEIVEIVKEFESHNFVFKTGKWAKEAVGITMTLTKDE